MNERIRELAEEVWPNLDNDPRIIFSSVDVKRFAELIVRECIAEIHAADVGELKGKSYYLDKVAEHIEKHFGVEERDV